MIIAVDGTSASGKGTLAKRLASKINYAYLDTGLLYRAVAFIADKQGSLENKNRLVSIANNLRLNSLNIEDLKSDKTAVLASKIATIEEVRKALLDYQLQFANNPNLFSSDKLNPYQGAILDGRDIGTVVCKNAPLKFYITASLEIRARRRYEELKRNNSDLEFNEVLESIKLRDQRDFNRKSSPLKKAEDAIEIDNSSLTIEETVDLAYSIWKKL